MKEKTKVVYVRDAHRFILDEFLMFDRSVGDPAVDSLRKNYAELRQKVNLPEMVGVVTYSSIIRRECDRYLAELEPEENKRTTAHYIPLEALERMLMIKGELEVDGKNSLTREYAYRMLGALALNSLILLERNKPQQAAYLMAASNIPHALYAIEILADMHRTFKESGNDLPAAEHIFQEARRVMDSMASWQGIEELHSIIKTRFALNRVSREFPLRFQPQGWIPPALYSVSLVERVEVGKGYEGIVDLLTAGSKASGQERIPQDIMDHIEQLYKKDKFGATKRADKFGDLLLSLPEPKTIITDTYIADAFPEIVENYFESVEIR